MPESWTTGLAIYGSALATITAATGLVKSFRERDRVIAYVVLRFESENEVRRKKPPALTFRQNVKEYPLPKIVTVPRGDRVDWNWLDHAPPVPEHAIRLVSSLYGCVINAGRRPLTIAGFGAKISYFDSHQQEDAFVVPDGFPVTLAPTTSAEGLISIPGRPLRGCSEAWAEETTKRRWIVPTRDMKPMFPLKVPYVVYAPSSDSGSFATGAETP